MRLGDHSSALARSRQLLTTYLTSSFTYEALTLAGHCQRLLQQPENALNAYRYVVRSRNEQESNQEFHREHDQILAQKRELSRLERESLEKKQVALHAEIDSLQSQLSAHLDVVKERTETGTHLLQDYYAERMDIFGQLDDLQNVIEVAEREERPDLASQARKQLARLVRVLETFRSDQEVVNTAFLIDFPLAAQEASNEYQRQNNLQVRRELELEKRRLERNLELLTEYQRVGRSAATEGDREDLEILQDDLDHLRSRLSALRNHAAAAAPALNASNADWWDEIGRAHV